jgi:hypothetical protein
MGSLNSTSIAWWCITVAVLNVGAVVSAVVAVTDEYAFTLPCP